MQTTINTEKARGP